MAGYLLPRIAERHQMPQDIFSSRLLPVRRRFIAGQTAYILSTEKKSGRGQQNKNYGADRSHCVQYQKR